MLNLRPEEGKPPEGVQPQDGYSGIWKCLARIKCTLALCLLLRVRLLHLIIIDAMLFIVFRGEGFDIAQWSKSDANRMSDAIGSIDIRSDPGWRVGVAIVESKACHQPIAKPRDARNCLLWLHRDAHISGSSTWFSCNYGDGPNRWTSLNLSYPHCESSI